MARFAPVMADFLDEAVERCGIDPASLEHRHLVSIRRSLNLLLVEMEASDVNEEDYIDQQTVTVGAGRRAVDLPDDTVDVLDATIEIPGQGGITPLGRTTRQDDLTIERSLQAGTPARYWVSRTAVPETRLMGDASGTGTAWGGGPVGSGTFGGNQTSIGGATNVGPSSGPFLVLSPPPASDIMLTYHRIRQIEPATIISAPLDVRRNWYEAMCAGAAWKISMKLAPERSRELKQEWIEARKTADIESRERGPLIIGYRSFGRSRRRRA